MEELLGIAMGCMGMTMKDFCQCAPSEFYAAWKAWSDAEDRRERGAWERMRMESVCVLQPYAKNRLKAKDVMVFPWETEAGTKTAAWKRHRTGGATDTTGEGTAEAPCGREEMMERYRRAMGARGLK